MNGFKKKKERLDLIADYLEELNDALPQSCIIENVLEEPYCGCVSARVSHHGQKIDLKLAAEVEETWESYKKYIKGHVINLFLTIERRWLEMAINGYEDVNRL